MDNDTNSEKKGFLKSVKKKTWYIIAACVCVAIILSVVLANSSLGAASGKQIAAMMRGNLPFDPPELEGDFIEIKLEEGLEYVPEMLVPLGTPSDFDLLNDDWWNRNVGHDPAKLVKENEFVKNVSIKINGYVLEGAWLRNDALTAEINAKGGATPLYIIMDDSDVTIRDSLIEGTIRVYDKTSTGVRNHGSVILEKVTFNGEKIPDTATMGMGFTARFCLIQSFNDGAHPTGGLSQPSLFEYNWFKGPGYTIAANHMDGIQIWHEGNTVVRNNKFSGYTNSCMLIKSDEKPRFGDEPICNVLVDGNYFMAEGLNYYYLFISPNNINAVNYYQTRPQYVTVTNNWFESKKKFPVCSNTTEAAMFVRTEEERDEGVTRQELFPEVLALRQQLGYGKSAVDARTWIVWDNNRYVEDGSEVRPDADPAYRNNKGVNKGWYDLVSEREKYPLKIEKALVAEAVPELEESTDLVVRFVSAPNKNYTDWEIYNPNSYKVTADWFCEEKEKSGSVTVGAEATVGFRTMTGDSSLVITWLNEDGEKLQITVPYGGQSESAIPVAPAAVPEAAPAIAVPEPVKPTDLSARFVSAPNKNYSDWEIYNPNPFKITADWFCEEKDRSGSVTIAAEATAGFRTMTGDSTLVITWLDEFGKKMLITVPYGGQSLAAIPAASLASALAEPEPEPVLFTVEFVESTAGSANIQWILVNDTDGPLECNVILPGMSSERTMQMKPGENTITAQKIFGENDLVVNWLNKAGVPQTMTVPGVNFVTIDLFVRFVSAPNKNYTDWEIYNPNPFKITADWSCEEKDRSGSISLGAEATAGFRTMTGDSPLVVTWLNVFGEKMLSIVPYGRQSEAAIPASSYVPMPSAYVEPEPESEQEPEPEPEPELEPEPESEPELEPEPEPESEPEPEPESESNQ